MENDKSCRWVSELIGDEYKEWENDYVFLGCGTGRGKTTFSLGTYCKWLVSQGKSKILYLCNRTKLKEQISDKIEGDKDLEILKGHVAVRTYQWLESMLNRKNGFHAEYDAILADEIHYLLSDAGFNICTDLSFDFIISQNVPTVFMSATYQITFEWIQRELLKRECDRNQRKYFLNTDYSYVERVVFFEHRHLYGIIDRIINDTNDKFLYFINGISRMERVYNHYNPDGERLFKKKYKDYLPDSTFRKIDFQCSPSTKNRFGKLMNKRYPEVMIKNEQGENGEDNGYTIRNRGLIATKYIDNGVDFKDRAIKHIICDVFDPESAIQCLGRKRKLDSDDRCTFYIRKYKASGVRIFLKNAEDKLESPKLFKKSPDEWKKKYGVIRGYRDDTIYKNHKLEAYVLNRLRFHKLTWDYEFISQIQTGELDYKEYILDYLGDSAKKVSVDADFFQMEKVHDLLSEFLVKHNGEPLDKNMQKELIDLCHYTDGRRRLLKGRGTISAQLTEDYGFEIQEKRHMVNGERQTDWIITPVKE